MITVLYVFPGYLLSLVKYIIPVRATSCKYRESQDSSGKTFLVNYFSEIYFKSFTFLWKLGKFEISLNHWQLRWPVAFSQNCMFSPGQYRKKTCTICINSIGHLGWLRGLSSLRSKRRERGGAKGKARGWENRKKTKGGGRRGSAWNKSLN